MKVRRFWQPYENAPYRLEVCGNSLWVDETVEICPLDRLPELIEALQLIERTKHGLAKMTRNRPTTYSGR